MSEAYECLIVVFKPTLTLALSSQASGPALTLDNNQFRDGGDYAWNCFYDWLRCEEKRVIGVRFWLWSEMAGLREPLTQYPYTRAGKENKSVEIFFSDNRQIEEVYSKDQEFYENRILVAANHEYAITFGTRYLAATDLEDIQKARATWDTPVWALAK